MTHKILQNEVECLKCGDRIYSASRHDYKTCGCGNISVDGGMSYLRRVGGVEYRDISVAIDNKLYDKIAEALVWAKNNNRNELGTVCALFRAIRDSGYELKDVHNGELDK